MIRNQTPTEWTGQSQVRNKCGCTAEERLRELQTTCAAAGTRHAWVCQECGSINEYKDHYDA